MAIHAVMCGGEDKHVCVRVCLCVLRTCVSVSRGELRPSSPPAPRAHVVSCGPLLEVLLSLIGIWAALGACWGRPGLLGSCAPGEDFDENQLIKYGSRGLFEGSLGDPFELVREWGRSCGLLGDSLGSWAPGEDFKGAGGSRSHAGVTLFPWSRGGAGGLQQPPSTTSGHRGQNILQNEVTKTVSYRTRNFPFGKSCFLCDGD